MSWRIVVDLINNKLTYTVRDYKLDPSGMIFFYDEKDKIRRGFHVTKIEMYEVKDPEVRA